MGLLAGRGEQEEKDCAVDVEDAKKKEKTKKRHSFFGVCWFLVGGFEFKRV